MNQRQCAYFLFVGGTTILGLSTFATMIYLDLNAARLFCGNKSTEKDIKTCGYADVYIGAYPQHCDDKDRKSVV